MDLIYTWGRDDLRTRYGCRNENKEMGGGGMLQNLFTKSKAPLLLGCRKINSSRFFEMLSFVCRVFLFWRWNSYATFHGEIRFCFPPHRYIIVYIVDNKTLFDLMKNEGKTFAEVSVGYLSSSERIRMCVYPSSPATNGSHKKYRPLRFFFPSFNDRMDKWVVFT